jgi:hypothetical protein
MKTTTRDARLLKIAVTAFGPRRPVRNCALGATAGHSFAAPAVAKRLRMRSRSVSQTSR